MTWDYRVMRTAGLRNKAIFAIHEVFYSDRGRVDSWTAESIGPEGETIAELRSDLKMMQKALTAPILNSKNGKPIGDKK